MTDNQNGQFHIEQVTIETDETTKPDGQKISHKKITFDTEDIIAIGAFFVAAVTILAIVVGLIPLNEYSVGLAGFSGAGGVIAKIIAARKKSSSDGNKQKKK